MIFYTDKKYYLFCIKVKMIGKHNEPKTNKLTNENHSMVMKFAVKQREKNDGIFLKKNKM